MSCYRLEEWDDSGFTYGRSKFTVFMWFLCQDTLFRFSPIPFYGFRRWLLRCFGCKVGQGVIIRPRARLHYPWRIEIGDYVSIGDDAWLYSIGTIKIGRHSIISQKSFLCTAGHDYEDPNFRTTVKPIWVGKGVWIGADVFVAPGVTVGDNAVIGARSSVFQNIPPGAISYGHPCKVVKWRNDLVSIDL
jgi:putative colanic acid biosynthesis acetyltransferase WcaF